MYLILTILIGTVIADKVNVYNNEYQKFDVSPSSILVSDNEDDFYVNEVKSDEESKDKKSRGSITYSDERIEQFEDGSYNGKYVDNNIPGVSGKDFPTYSEIPKTSFSCKGKKISGYYADVETDCQVFHICLAGGHKISFLCPKGSVFNQRVLVCDWWYDVDCQTSNQVADFIEEVLKNMDHYQNQEVIQYNNFAIDNGYDLNLASSGGNDHPKSRNNDENVDNNSNGGNVKNEEVKENVQKDDREKNNQRLVKNKNVKLIK